MEQAIGMTTSKILIIMGSKILAVPPTDLGGPHTLKHELQQEPAGLEFML